MQKIRTKEGMCGGELQRRQNLKLTPEDHSKSTWCTFLKIALVLDLCILFSQNLEYVSGSCDYFKWSTNILFTI